MNFALFTLILIYIGIVSAIFNAVKSYSNTGVISFDYAIGTIFLILFSILATNQYVKSSKFQKNTDAIFSYFPDCSTAIVFKGNEKPKSPFLVEACGKSYNMHVSKGRVEHVEEIEEK